MAERELDQGQLLRAGLVFGKLAEPSDDFFKVVRSATTTFNDGLHGIPETKGGISVMMPYQYWYHRLGEPTDLQYPRHELLSAAIGFYPTDALNSELGYIPEYSVDDPRFNSPRVLTSYPSHVSEAKLASFERFADRITTEWMEYEVGQSVEVQDRNSWVVCNALVEKRHIDMGIRDESFLLGHYSLDQMAIDLTITRLGPGGGNYIDIEIDPKSNDRELPFGPEQHLKFYPVGLGHVYSEKDMTSRNFTPEQRTWWRAVVRMIEKETKSP
jgi:hypothetical protein